MRTVRTARLVGAAAILNTVADQKAVKAVKRVILAALGSAARVPTLETP